jgi:hypothetical protein
MLLQRHLFEIMPTTEGRKTGGGYQWGGGGIFLTKRLSAVIKTEKVFICSLFELL